MTLFPRRILLRAPNWLGDGVMSLPCCANLRTAFPEAELVVACRPHLAECYHSSLAVDRILLTPGSGRGLKALFEIWREGARHRGEGFDLGILLTNSLSTALWLWRTGARRRVGFARDGRKLLLTDRPHVTPELAAAHQADYYLYLLGCIGASTIRHDLRLTIRSLARAEGRALLDKYQVAPGAYLVLAPVSAYGAVKDWPAAHFAAAARWAVRERGMPVLVTGVAAHREACEAIAEAAGDGVINVAGETGVAGFFGLMALARAFLGNDSGGAHVAAACGLPTVVIFGITEPSRTRPLGERVTILGEGGAVTPDLDDPAVQDAAEAALAAIAPEAACEALAALLDSA